MTLAWQPSIIAQRILDLLTDEKLTLYGQDAMLFYGDQSRVPVSPSICVEPGETERVLAGAQGPNGRTENKLECHILIYYARVEDNQITKKTSDELGEATANYLDNNVRLERSGDGGIVIHGFVSRVDPGYQFKRGTLYHAVRLTWTGKTKTMLGA